MHFERSMLYHIYNHGNNWQKIFFNRENYLFFLRKIKTHMVPYADILAWCLMPNHFHLIVYVKEVELGSNTDTEGFAYADHPKTGVEQKEISLRNSVSEALGCKVKSRTLNQSIGIMLRSYTNAINNQNGTSGSLFRKQTKAQCLNQLNGITPSYYNTNAGTLIHVDDPEKQYPQVCFNYIHQNPVKSGLVKTETDWEYSSAKDYAGLRNGKLVNKERARRLLSGSSKS